MLDSQLSAKRKDMAVFDELPPPARALTRDLGDWIGADEVAEAWASVRPRCGSDEQAVERLRVKFERAIARYQNRKRRRRA